MTNEEARALVERLRFYAGRGGTPISDAFLDAADLIKSLLAERDSFEALWRSTMDVLEAERAERDALARDAARIQWLDEHALSMDAVADPDGFVWVWHGTDPARKIRGKTLREAIDRAMKGASDA